MSKSTASRANENLLSLSDVRDYLVDTNAVKEAENLLLGIDESKGGKVNRDEDYSDHTLGKKIANQDKLGGLRARKGQSNSQRKEQLMNHLMKQTMGNDMKSKLGLLREEEEMKELQQVEIKLREENTILERERMRVAAQAESAKREELRNIEAQVEQEMMQLEVQRSNATNDLERKAQVIDRLKTEIKEVEKEMNDTAYNTSTAMTKEKEAEQSKEARAKQMFDLVKEHTLEIVSAQNEGREAMNELKRINASKKVNAPIRVGNKYVGETSGLLNTDFQSTADLLDSPERGQVDVDAMINELGLNDANTLSVMQDRVTKLNKQAVLEKEELSDIDSLMAEIETVAKEKMERKKNVMSTQEIHNSLQDETTNKLIRASGREPTIRDSIDSWIETTDSNAEQEAAAKTLVRNQKYRLQERVANQEADREMRQQQQQQQQQQRSTKSPSGSNLMTGGIAVNNSDLSILTDQQSLHDNVGYGEAKLDGPQSQYRGPTSLSGQPSRSNMSLNSGGYNDNMPGDSNGDNQQTLIKDLLDEIKRLKEDQTQMREQQQQWFSQGMPLNGPQGMPGAGALGGRLPPASSTSPSSNPYMNPMVNPMMNPMLNPMMAMNPMMNPLMASQQMNALSMAQQQQQRPDPMVAQAVEQMARMNEQMERENAKLMQQIQQPLGAGLPEDPIGGGGYGSTGTGGGYGGEVPGSGIMNPRNNRMSANQRYGNNSNSNYAISSETGYRPYDGEDPYNYRNNMSHAKRAIVKKELKFDDEIRLLHLEMEKTRKQSELEDFKYEVAHTRELRQAEDKHNSWLEGEKRELMAQKMALEKAKTAKMHDMLNKSLDATGNIDDQASAGGSVDGLNQGPKRHIILEEAGVGTLPLPTDVIKGITVVVDGVYFPKKKGPQGQGAELGGSGDLPVLNANNLAAASGGNDGRSGKVVMDNPSMMDLQGDVTDGMAYRTVIFLLDSTGNLVDNKKAKSLWQYRGERQVFPNPTNGNSNNDNESVLGGMGASEDGNNNDIPIKDMGQAPMLPQTSTDWLMVPLKSQLVIDEEQRKNAVMKSGIKALVEIQLTNKATKEQKSLGYGLLNLVRNDDNGTTCGEYYLRNGFHRVNIRKGIADVNGNPELLPDLRSLGNDANSGFYRDGFILFRVGDSAESARQYNWQPQPPDFMDDLDVLKVYGNALASAPDIVDKPAPPAGGAAKRNSTAGSNKVGSRTSSRRNSKVPGSSSSAPKADNLQAILEGSESGSNPDNGGDNTNLAPPMSDPLANLKIRNDKADKVPWLKGMGQGPATEKYQKGDGVEIYLDKAMYLPDNCTLTRAQVKLFSAEKEPQDRTYEVWSPVDTIAMSPDFKYKVELRGSSLNLTSTILIRLDTLDSFTKVGATVGYSVIKVFCTKDREQPKSNNDPNVYINTGLYQVPIYCGRIPGNLDVFDETMLSSLPRIPCASILIRINAAPRSSDGLTVLTKAEVPQEKWRSSGLDVPMPVYSEGLYFSDKMEPSDMENNAYQAKAVNLSLTVDSALNQILSKLTEQEKTVFPPRPSGSDRVEINQWCTKLLPAANSMRKTIDYSFIAPYSMDPGINVSIDMLYNMPDQSGSLFTAPPCELYKVIYSIVPPGLYYTEPPMPEGVYFTKSEDVERPYRSPSFNDGFTFLREAPMLDRKSYLVIEVKTLTIDSIKGSNEANVIVQPPTIADKCYWTLLPIGREVTKGGGFSYTESGIFQLPLIKGPVPAKDLFQSDLTNPIEEILERLGPKGKVPTAKNRGGNSLKLAESGSSILLRICNPMFRDVLPFTSYKSDQLGDQIRNQMLEVFVKTAANGVTGPSIANMNKFSYDADKYSKDKKVKERVPAGIDLKKLSKDANKAFAKAANIKMD